MTIEQRLDRIEAALRAVGIPVTDEEIERDTTARKRMEARRQTSIARILRQDDA